MKLLTFVSAAAALVLPFAAQAEFDYTYLDGYYQRVNFDDIEEEANGYGLRGSVGLGLLPFQVTAEYNVAEFDVLGVEADTDQWALGVGYHLGLGPVVDLVTNLSYVGFDSEFGEDGDGYRAGVGLRGRLTPWVELNGGIRYSDVESSDGETSMYARGLLGSSNIRLLLEVEAADAGQVYLIGGRIDF